MFVEKIIPIDHGNRNVKTENFIFTSGLTESDSRPPFGEYLKYQGKYYSLTEQRIPYMRDKTMDERFFILSLFAIAMETEKDGSLPKDGLLRVCLPVGLPPKHFGALYQKFEAYFKRNELLEFSYRGKEYAVCVDDVMAFPQDYAAAMTVFSVIREYSRVPVIDLGGFTLDYLLLREGKPDLSVCDSLEKGVIILYNDIKSRVNSEYDILLEETDMDDIIQGKKTDYSQEIIRNVQDMTRIFVDDILGMLRERGLELKSGCVVFVGGGAILLESYIRASGKVGKCVFVSELQANARGYGMLYRLQKKGR